MEEPHVFAAEQVRAETLFTQCTPERLCVKVDDHVTIQAAVCGEGGFTHVTFKCLHACRETERQKNQDKTH